MVGESAYDDDISARAETWSLAEMRCVYPLAEVFKNILFILNTLAVPVVLADIWLDACFIFPWRFRHHRGECRTNVPTRIIRNVSISLPHRQKLCSMSVLWVEDQGIVRGCRSSENMDFVVCEDVSYMLISSPCFQVVPSFADVACW